MSCSRQIVNKNTRKPIKCFTCGGNHISRECGVEPQLAPENKKQIGNIMEHYIANNIYCPECNSPGLHVVGDHSPSLDIICKNCNHKFEVKSKCLSIQELPCDISLPHGAYVDYMNRLEENLNLIVAIYGVNRSTKNIYIKEILYAENSLLRDKKVIEVNKRAGTNLSTILIKNRLALTKLDTFSNYSKFSINNFTIDEH